MNMSVEKKKYPSALPINWPPREEPSRKSQNQLASPGKDYYYNRGVRINDATLVPPIRQTASIFKQPVTIYKTQEGKVKDVKHCPQEKPKQLFWEKRLEGLRACDPDGYEFDAMDLPKNLKPVGPYITEETLLQSVATALHVCTQPVTGQTGSKTALEKNPGVFLNPDQPLVQAVSIADEDIRKQEDRVAVARKKLQDALRAFQT
ncbi:methyl-CpG-binding domain protein 2 isoform X3 [Temnothorax americanus]|uniref:Methyl-CpG-binding domain protein 2 isoform X3 n=1 Tax=Temnothorax curvispinosus TaxID=300111 RepID=A0A6J1RDS5_9HYME|nr:methyl-CpG-binding domain protein 2 isoform X3 [Temnothorax curvispinosus]